MPSPIKPSDIAATVVDPLSKVCTRFDQLLKLPKILLTFWTWAFDSLGNATQDFKDLFLTIGVPIGGIIEWPVATIPTGFLLCNGQTVSRVTYANLYSVLGTMYGSGDGSTTFTLPDYQGIFLIGEGGAYTVGTSLYGEATHILTPAEGAIQDHIHGLGNWLSNDDTYPKVITNRVDPEGVSQRLVVGGTSAVAGPTYAYLDTINLISTKPLDAPATPSPIPMVPSCRAVKRLIKF